MRVATVNTPTIITATVRFQRLVPALKPVRPSAFSVHTLLCVIAGLLLSLNTAVLTAQTGNAPDYTSIVVFGDSLSDTGNLAHLTQDKYGVRVPGPLFGYTDGRATDGYDTLPPAQ